MTCENDPGRRERMSPRPGSISRRQAYFVSTGTFREVLDGDFVSSTISTPLS